MEILPLVQVYGPLGLGWVIAGYLKLATSLDGLAQFMKALP